MLGIRRLVSSIGRRSLLGSHFLMGVSSPFLVLLPLIILRTGLRLYERLPVYVLVGAPLSPILLMWACLFLAVGSSPFTTTSFLVLNQGFKERRWMRLARGAFLDGVLVGIGLMVVVSPILYGLWSYLELLLLD